MKRKPKPPTDPTVLASLFHEAETTFSAAAELIARWRKDAAKTTASLTVFDLSPAQAEFACRAWKSVVIDGVGGPPEMINSARAHARAHGIEVPADMNIQTDEVTQEDAL